MGGTFDPIHHGHLVAASEVQARFDLDEVVFVPTGQPYEKGGGHPGRGPLPDDGHRDRLEPALPRQPGRHRPGRAPPTPSTPCVTCARSTARTAELFFITGADALARILSWKDALEMLDLAHFVGVTRPGFELSGDHLPADTVTLVEVPAMAISSTDCRARVAAGKPVWYLVPDGVVQYINKRGLYRGSGNVTPV